MATDIAVPALRHGVQFYDSDEVLGRRVVAYLGEALASGGAAIAIATRAHLGTFVAGLATRGIDTRAAIADERLLLVDTDVLLTSVMAGTAPDAASFEETIGGLLARARAAAPSGPLRAYGELVDVLVRAGNPRAALQLERLWNGLAAEPAFELLCGYTLGNFAAAQPIQEICALHDHVAGAHDPGTNGGAHDTLLREISRRNAVEAELRDANLALRRSEDSERARAARILRLQHATTALASAVSLGEVTDVILDTSVHLIGASSAVVYLRGPDGTYRVQGARGLPAGYARWRELALDAPVPLARALATETPQWFESHDQLATEFPMIASSGIEVRRLQAVAALPLLHGARPTGGLGLSFENARAFPDEERVWFESYGAQCALAIERARLYEAEQKARGEAETLFRIAESLSDPRLDLEAILQRVTDEATAMVGAELGAFVYNTTDARPGAYLLHTLSGVAQAAFAKVGVAGVMPLLAPAFSGTGVVRLDDVHAAPPAGDLAPGASPTTLTSYLAVPVKTRAGEAIGALVFGHAARGRFTAEHERLVKALASTTGIAIENARLYRARRDGENASRRLVEQLVETVHMNELFTGVLAHDLRNPLAAITTAAQLLLYRHGTGDERTVHRILGSSQRMARMIEQLLDFTRLRVGTGLPLEPAACDLAPLLTQVVDEVRTAHPQHALRVHALGNTHGAWDADRLGQAFSNLIGNAAQHGAPEAGIDIHIDGTDPAQLRVAIHNAGAVPIDLLPRIFEPMIGGQRRRDGSRGLGLGLFISQQIATAHGGRLEVASSEIAGTTFTLVLPRHVAAAGPRAPAPLAPTLAPTTERRWETEPRMRHFVDSLHGVAIIMLDPDGRIRSWNQTAETLTGYARDAIIGQPIATLFAADDAAMLAQELRRAVELGMSERESSLARPDGGRTWTNTVISVIHDATEAHGWYAVVMRDVTAQRAARERLAENEKRMRLLVESVRDYAIFMLDVDGRVRSWNRGAELAKGYAAHEIIGQHMSAFYTRGDREAGRPQWILQRAIDEGRCEDIGWRVRKDGSRFWADVVITALRDEHGALYGFAKVTRDLSERRVAEEELRRSEERFRLLVDAVQDYAIFMLDPTGHVVTWNAGAERIKGYAANEIVGQHFSRFYERADVRAGLCERELAIAARDGRFEDEGWRIRKDGSRFWASLVLTPLRNANGELLGYAKVTRDLTQRRRLEDERLRLVQAQEGIRLRDEFLSIVSHELKTPLAGLLLQLDALRVRGDADPRTQTKLARAYASGERLHELIESLLDVSRIATGRFVLTPEPAELVEVVTETVASFQAAAARAGCALGVHAPAPIPGSWDRVRIAQVVSNLLANAFKYAPGHPVEVRIERAGDDAILEVRDHGAGIDPAHAARIFERFERAVSARHYGGFGLGLYVVREIVSAHGGSVVAANAPDGGARIIARLPVLPEVS